MLNPSDKELDRLSREAADHYEPDEDISSWEQLVPRLDREIGLRPNAAFRFFGRGTAMLALAAVTFTGIFFYLMKQHQPANKSVNTKTDAPASLSNSPAEKKGEAGHALKNENQKLNAESSEGKSLQIRSSDGPGNADNSDKSKATASGNQSDPSNKNSARIRDKSSGSEGNEVSAGNSLTQTQSQSSSSLNTERRTGNNQRAGGAAMSIVSANAGSKSINNRPGKNNLIQSNPSQIVQEPSSANSGVNEELRTVDFTSIAPALQSGAISTNFTLKNSSNGNIQLSKEAIDQSKSTQRVLRMSRVLKIGVLYGSDVTSVHSVEPEKLSQSWGLTLGYQFHDHWSINTGVIYTQKNYSANGKDFHLELTSWPGTNTKLDYVEGNCNMWEIPLTLRYDFDRINNTTLFINGGASSYLMTHEAYMYYAHIYNSYTGTSTPVQTQNPQPYNTKEDYLFSVIDFSLGVEQKLSRSLSFQVEPYIKIPVKGVGLGQVDLSSYGVNLSIRYAPLLKSSRK